MDADADIVLSIDDEDGRVKGPIGSVMIGAVELPFTADSGSPLTLISDRTFDLKWQDVRLHETDVNPKAFGEHDILMRGYFWDSLTFRGHTVRTKIYVAEKGRSLVGWKDLAKLGVMLVPGAEDPIVLRDDWVNYVQPEDLHEGLAEVLDKFDSVFENKPIRIVDGCDAGGRRDEDKKRSARTRAGGGAPGGSSWALLFVARK
ncbi:hypothetical protein NDU88_001153 [Pleurodeles waltl]|uniref:Uncharacterized protein n=1 Tax=Pleurodeles waltl TaxID=8319 RepID=A0AAV7SZG9_PLEWA|nr:hypothetical protein NDU88_001153 [Pleurodeles waltl]